MPGVTHAEAILSLSQTLKGQGGDVIICEEAAAMDTEVFYEVVCPLLQMDAACLICISTVRGGQNFFSALMQMRNARGEPVFECITMKLVCDRPECVATPESCKHSNNKIPKWQSVRAHKRVKALMAREMGKFRQETLGVETEEHNPAFCSADVQRLFDARNFYQRPLMDRSVVRHCFVGIDPNANGPSDQSMALLFDLPNGGGIVVRHFFGLDGGRLEDGLERRAGPQHLVEQAEEAVARDLPRAVHDPGLAERSEELGALLERYRPAVDGRVAHVFLHRRRDVQKREEDEQQHVRVLVVLEQHPQQRLEALQVSAVVALQDVVDRLQMVDEDRDAPLGIALLEKIGDDVALRIAHAVLAGVRPRGEQLSK